MRLRIVMFGLMLGIVIYIVSLIYVLNIEDSFKTKKIINTIGVIQIETYGLISKKEKMVFIKSPFSIVIEFIPNKDIDRELIIKKLEIEQGNIKKTLVDKPIKEDGFYYDSEHIALENKDFIVKLEYQIKTKDKIIDGKIETKMEYERKIYLTCPLWDAMMSI